MTAWLAGAAAVAYARVTGHDLPDTPSDRLPPRRIVHLGPTDSAVERVTQCCGTFVTSLPMRHAVTDNPADVNCDVPVPAPIEGIPVSFTVNIEGR